MKNFFATRNAEVSAQENQTAAGSVPPQPTSILSRTN